MDVLELDIVILPILSCWWWLRPLEILPWRPVVQWLLQMVVVQYLVVRGDLLASLGWPLGAVMAQACHAATAAIHNHYSDEVTQAYLADLDNMHKVVLEAKGEAELRALASKLEEGGVQHKLWIEQPEDVPTCLATKPCTKEQVQKYFKKFKLYKGPALVIDKKSEDVK